MNGNAKGAFTPPQPGTLNPGGTYGNPGSPSGAGDVMSFIQRLRQLGINVSPFIPRGQR